MADKAAERIKYQTELLRLLWLSLLAVGSGTIGLMLGELTAVRTCFAGFGLLSLLGLTVAVIHTHQQIKTLIGQLPEG